MSEEMKNTAPTGQFEEVDNQTLPETTMEFVEEQETETLVEELLMNLSEQSLNEILRVFEEVLERGNQQEMYRCADPIKASFYKALKREKIAAGYVEPAAPVDETVLEEDGQAEEVSNNPFAEVERGFKELYARYKTLRSNFVQAQEQQKENNLAAKLQIIEEIKQLSEKQEDINQTFNEFRALQARWRETGPVPQARVKDVYETYQHHVEMFYDYVKINNELRDLDFKKNLASKIQLCEQAEALAAEENVISAFNRLQKLHEEWKEFGPVDRESRESIWNRFKAATSVINKKHQQYFEKAKEEQKANFVAKSGLCERAEAIAEREINEAAAWNKASKELENLQKEWKTIGFASKKDNQKVYERFRAACDKFFDRKREFYNDFKDQMTRNYEQKVALCEQAEALMGSTDWKATTEELIRLQQLWKESGPVSRKKSDQVWKRFRAACDHFFDNKEKNYGGVDPKLVENLQAKTQLIEEAKAYVNVDEQTDFQAAREFFNRWNAIGFVPIREKNRLTAEYKAVMAEKFPNFSLDPRARRNAPRKENRSRQVAPRSEREILIQQFRTKESELATYENNIGFFAMSRNADALIAQLQEKINRTRIELQELEERIKSLEN
ncbi:MAG: DUF349 domain-containing protein [Bacteroidales bacterium]|nr:DUF349 domain-containing protein [Bacteroidales bacterium]